MFLSLDRSLLDALSFSLGAIAASSVLAWGILWIPYAREKYPAVWSRDHVISLAVNLLALFSKFSCQDARISIVFMKPTNHCE